MLAIAWQSFRTRPGRFAGALVALSLGIALIAATGLVLSVPPPRHAQSRYPADSVVVTAAQRIRTADSIESARVPVPLPADAPARLARVAGVDSVTPDRRVDAVLMGTGTTAVVGHGWASAGFGPYGLAAGTPPRSDDDLVVDGRLGFSVGDRVTVLSDVDAHEYRISGVTVRTETAETPVFFTDHRAEALPGQLTGAVLRPKQDVRAADLAAAVREAAPDLDIGGTELDPVAEQYEEVGAVLGITAGLSGFVCVFLIASTFALSIAQRRRELALLRLVGASPRQVRRMVLGEALVLGVLGAAAGNALAVPVAHALVALLHRLNVGPARMDLRLTWVPAAVASGIGLVVALAGVWVAARRTRKVRAVEALRTAAVETRPMTASRWLFGALGLAGGTAMLWGAASTSGDGRIALLLWVGQVLVIGVAALAPVLVPPLVGLAARPLRRLVTVQVAEANLRAQARRTASVAAPILVMLGIAGSVLTATASLSASSSGERAARLAAPVVIAPAAAPGLPASAIEAARRVPGVASVTPVGRTDVFLRAGGDVPATVLPDGDFAGPALRWTVRAGSLDAQGFVATADTAGQWHWSIGEEVPIRLGDGTQISLRLAATVDGGLDANPLVLPRSAVAGHAGAWSTRHALVTLADGADAGAARTAIDSALRGLGAAVPAADWLAGQDAAEREGIRIGLVAIFGMAAVYTAIAIVNTVAMAVRERAAELAQLRLAGATSGQALGVLLCEGGLVLVVGIGLAAVVTGVTAAALPGALGSVSSAARLSIPWPILAAATAGCAALVGAATLLASSRHVSGSPGVSWI